MPRPSLPRRLAGRAAKALARFSWGTSVGGPYGGRTGWGGGFSRLFLPGTDYDYAAETIGVGVWKTAPAYIALAFLARNACRADLTVTREAGKSGDRDPVAGHRLVTLLDRPNKFYSYADLLKFTILQFSTGDAYWIKLRGRARGEVGAVVPVPSWTMVPWSDDPAELINHYRYDPGNGVAAIDLDPADVVHFRNGIDPDDPTRGLSDFGYLARELFTDNALGTWLAALSRNMGTPPLLIGPDNESDTIQDGDLETLKATIFARTTGEERGKPLVMASRLKVDKLSWSLKDMDVGVWRNAPVDRILAAVGLNAMALGLPSSSRTYSNYQESLRSAWNEGIVPLLECVAETLYHQLLPDLGDPARERVEFDYSRVPAMAEDRDAAMTRAVMGWKEGLTTRGASCTIAGIDPPDDGTADLYVWEAQFEAAKKYNTGIDPPGPTLPRLVPGNPDVAPPGADDGDAAPPESAAKALPPPEGEEGRPFGVEAKAAPGYDPAARPAVPDAAAILRDAARLADIGLDAWRAGALDDDARLALLRAVRATARAWLRAEAEALLDAEGLTPEGKGDAPPDLATKALSDRLRRAVGGFFGRARQFVREAVVAGVLALNGPGAAVPPPQPPAAVAPAEPGGTAPAEPTPATEPQSPVVEAVEAAIREQMEFLDGFQAAVESSDTPPGAPFAARAELYGNAPYGAGQEAARRAAAAGPIFTQERREHRAADEPCPTCSEQLALGWQPVGTLRRIGDSECMNACHCVFIFRDEADPDAEYVAGRVPPETPAHPAASPAPTPPTPPAFGPSRAAVRPVMGTEAEMTADARLLLGRDDATLADLASLAGAPDDATAEIYSHGAGASFSVNFRGDGYSAMRSIRRDDDGRLVVDNVEFHVAPDRQGQGIGRAVFGRAVEQATRLGADRIVTLAARSDAAGEFGYRVWPRFGYDAELDDETRGSLPEGLAGAARLSDLMRTPEGRAWWDANGRTAGMTFDLAPGSLSRAIWDAYLAAKRAAEGGA